MGFDTFIQYDINIYTGILLVTMLGIIYLKKDVYSFSSKMFRIILITNIVMLVLELLSWAFEGIDTQLAWFLNYSMNFILVLLTPIIACFWASYIDHKIFKSIERVKRRHYYLFPFYIGAVMSIINIFYPILFSVSENNHYSREPFIWVNVATMFSLLVYTIIVAYKNRKIVNQNVFLGVTIFLFLPAIGSVFQMLYLGVLLIWPMFALGIVVAYIFLETVGTSRDYLTNLFTRVKSNEYLMSLIDHQREFSVIMIDLDNFKELNDNFGHAEGDSVLRSFGIILLNIFDKDCLVSRFGGDEFFIITNKILDEELLEFKKTIYSELQNPMYLNDNLKTLRFSYGYTFYQKRDKKTIDELIVEADNKMYQDKAVNKNYRRRKSDA